MKIEIVNAKLKRNINEKYTKDSYYTLVLYHRESGLEVKKVFWFPHFLNFRNKAHFEELFTILQNQIL
jgi:hypothetical protein